MYCRHHASRTQSNYVNRISCTNASDAIESPPSSASSTDVTNKFPLEAFAAYNEVRNVDAANAIAHSIHDQRNHFAAAPAFMTLQFCPFNNGQKTFLQKAIPNHTARHVLFSLMRPM